MPKKRLNNYFPNQEKQRIQGALDQKLLQIEEWGREQLKTAGKKNHLSSGVIHAVKEAVVVPERVNADMQHLKNMLITLSGNSPITDNEEKIIDKYIEKIDKLLGLYADLNEHHPLINDNNISPEEVILGLNQKYNDPQFYEMMETLASLEFDKERINSIAAKYEDALKRKNAAYNEARTILTPMSNPENPARGTQTRDIAFLTSMPMQNLPRVSMVIRAIDDQIKKFRDTDPAPDYHVEQQAPNTPNAAIADLFTQTAGCLERSGPKNSELQKKIGEKTVANQTEALYSSKGSGSSAEQKQAFFLREILNLNLNTPKAKSDEARVKDFPAYLEAVLVKCYPETFALNAREELLIKAGANATNYINIHNALDVPIIGETNKIKLNPAQFDAAMLDELYNSEQNALWLVLKSTKPIDANFTAENKVKTYIELAQAYKAQKIGDTEKYLGAYNMAQAALAIAQEHPECQELVHNAFGPKSELGQWIISKHSKQDQAKIGENLSQYAHAQYLKSVEPPTFKKQVISPSQALLLLIDHYQAQRDKLAAANVDPEKVKAAVEKVAELKKLYLLGVRVGEGQATARKFDVNENDLKKMAHYLADPYLSSYEVSKDKKIINNDPSRRYFETHLAYETVKNQIDSMDKDLLQTHVNKLTEALGSHEKEAETCAKVFSNTYEGESPLHKEYANYIAKITSKELYSELNDEQREKVLLVVKSSLLGVANALVRGAELPINIYNSAPLYGNWRGKESIKEQDKTANAHMGLMKGYMPVAQDDIATSTKSAPPVKPSDQATYKEEKGEYIKWVEMNFAGLVHPFSNSISGTMLCQLRNMAEQKNGDATKASGITDSAFEIEKYARVFIAAMLYGSGGHTLNEYSFPFQLEEVQNEFAGVDGFKNINLETLFLDNNDMALNKAINEAITYNAHFLQKQRINQDVKFVSSHHDKLELAQAIVPVVQKIEKYESDVEKMFFSQYRTASEKVDIMKPAIEQIIDVLKEGKVKDALEMSDRLMKRLEHDYGTKGFTGGEKKSYQIAKEIHEIISELDSKLLSRKENIASANLSFKERLQQFKAQERPLEAISESENALPRGNHLSQVISNFKVQIAQFKKEVNEHQEEEENNWDRSL
ncbi:hypothetical protein Lsan_1179 [Legionella santicrucis]|uniref:Uncharacterized protein n=1 Tax=Legionella santicrucis TaxID=45074 RepID=A0A0W0Z3Q3_9GAMM|nr:hypothetical protein [Legionella santicrucis]KTD63746.1 hypothetical protein Lsan_1179 [Legionella santicrucis]